MSWLQNTFLITNFILTCSCGPSLHIEGFEEYVHRFEKDSGALHIAISNLSVSLGDIMPDAVGECSDGPSITIDRGYWNTADDASREHVMYHEMGHCILGRQHTMKLMPWHIPDSIMWPTDFLEAWYTYYHAHYIEELFSQGESSTSAEQRANLPTEPSLLQLLLISGPRL